MRDADSPEGGTLGIFQKCHIGVAGAGVAGGTVKCAAFHTHRIDGVRDADSREGGTLVRAMTSLHHSRPVASDVVGLPLAVDWLRATLASSRCGLARLAKFTVLPPA